jgi:hypothetical protein
MYVQGQWFCEDSLSQYNVFEGLNASGKGVTR